MKNDLPISFENVRNFFKSGELWQKEPKELNHCLRGLAIEAEVNEAIRHHHLIIASAIQSILLTRILDEQEKRNRKLQWIIIGLTALYTVLTGTQLYLWTLK